MLDLLGPSRPPPRRQASFTVLAPHPHLYPLHGHLTCPAHAPVLRMCTPTSPAPPTPWCCACVQVAGEQMEADTLHVRKLEERLRSGIQSQLQVRQATGQALFVFLAMHAPFFF